MIECYLFDRLVSNHTILPLDEAGQAILGSLSATLYMVANGAGKSRSQSRGGNRRLQAWLTLVLSTSEDSFDQLIEQGQGRAKAGLGVRMLDIPAEVRNGYGCFEELHGEASGSAFAEAMRHAILTQHGTAGPAFLEWLVARLKDQPDFVAQVVVPRISSWCRDVVPNDADGQVKRSGRRMATIAIAGDLATEAGITGWPELHTASDGVKAVFRDWLLERGGTDAREDMQAVSQLRAFILAHGSARFDIWADAPLPEVAQVESDPYPPAERFRTQKRAGWRRWKAGEDGLLAWCYYLTGDAMKEALTGLAVREARKTLVKLNYLLPSKNATDVKNGVLAASHPVPGHPKTRLYQINSTLFDATDGRD